MVYLFVLNLILVSVIVWEKIEQNKFMDNVLKHLGEIQNKFMSKDWNSYYQTTSAVKEEMERKKIEEAERKQKILDEETKLYGKTEEI